ncbi:MAG: hypothetical protein ACO1TE_22145 [Prosthecobacter sp.]
MVPLVPLTWAAEEEQPALALTAAQQQALEQFGRSLAQAMTDKDGPALKAHLDPDEFGGRVLQKMPDMTAEMRQVITRSINKRPGGWMDQKMSGNVVFLRTRERLGFPAVQLRLRSETDSLSYADVLVRPDGAGFKVVDLYDYTMASLISEEIGNMLAVSINPSGGAGLAKVLGIPGIKNEVMVDFRAMAVAAQMQDAPEVLRLHDTLPEEIRRTRGVFSLRLQALMRLSNQGSQQAAQAFEGALRQAPEILGKESATDLLMTDLLLQRQDFQGVDDCLKRTEAAIGGDPYLKLLRGNMRLQMKDYVGVLALADAAEREADSGDPTQSEAMDLRITVHLQRKDFAAAVKELRACREKFGAVMDRQAFAGDALYEDLLKSPEFAAWEKELAQ